MKTIRQAASHEVLIKRSRFVAHAAPVRSQAETLAFYESVTDPQATHNCWAWRVDGIGRFNDDGEPGGSAGRPILSVIEGRQLDRIMVVVTRYFGGIKLGIGGLIRAYSGCANGSIERAGIVDHQPLRHFELQSDFAFAQTIHHLLDQYQAAKLSEDWDNEGLRLHLAVPENQVRPFTRAVRDSGRGTVSLKPIPGKS